MSFDGSRPPQRQGAARGLTRTVGRLLRSLRQGLAAWRITHRRMARPDAVVIGTLRRPRLAIAMRATVVRTETSPPPLAMFLERMLADRQHISRIKEQLDPSHGELVRERFLARWEYRKAASQQDYVMTYWPGHKFFEDQQAREIRRHLAEQLAQQPETPANPAHAALTGADQTLLDEILAVCGDAGNQAAYQKVLREHPEGLLWMAISETRQASREHRITKTKGAYFMATVKDLAARWATAQRAPLP